MHKTRVWSTGEITLKLKTRIFRKTYFSAHLFTTNPI